LIEANISSSNVSFSQIKTNVGQIAKGGVKSLLDFAETAQSDPSEGCVKQRHKRDS
jgi:hypothetical protein